MNAQHLFFADAAQSAQSAAAQTTAAPAAQPSAEATAVVPAGKGTQEPPPQAGFLDGIVGMLPFIIVIVVMFYLMARSQKKEQKRRQDMIDALKKGDTVLTIGGIYGEVAEIKDEYLIVKIADNVKVTIAKTAVSTVKNPGEETKVEKK